MDPGHASRRQVRHALVIAHELDRDVVVTNVTLGELYRGAARTQAVDALLSRERDGLVLRDTDRALAKLVGGLLHGAGLGSEHIADAHVAAAVVEEGGIVLTSDPADLERLLVGASHVTVVPLRDSRP